MFCLEEEDSKPLQFQMLLKLNGKLVQQLISLQRDGNHTANRLRHLLMIYRPLKKNLVRYVGKKIAQGIKEQDDNGGSYAIYNELIQEPFFCLWK